MVGVDFLLTGVALGLEMELEVAPFAYFQGLETAIVFHLHPMRRVRGIIDVNVGYGVAGAYRAGRRGIRIAITACQMSAMTSLALIIKRAGGLICPYNVGDMTIAAPKPIFHVSPVGSMVAIFFALLYLGLFNGHPGATTGAPSDGYTTCLHPFLAS